MNSVKLFKVLSEPIRLRILALIKSTALSVSELVEILGQSQSNVSHHIKLLTELDLIDSQKKGNLNLYKLKTRLDLPDYLQEIFSNLDETLKEISDAIHDHEKMLTILASRKQRGFAEDWNNWRQIQPDLPHTFELALNGKIQSGLALDIGCGDGQFMRDVANSFDNVIGIDISQEQLLRGSKNSKVAGLIKADGASLPFKENIFDTIYFRMSLNFFEEKERALSEALQTLKNPGRIAIIDLDLAPLSADFFRRFCAQKKNLRNLAFKKYSNVFISVIQKLK